MSICSEPRSCVESLPVPAAISNKLNGVPTFFAAAEAARQAGDTAEAERMWHLIVSMCDKSGNNGEQLLEALENLTRFNLTRHRFVSAETFCKRSVELALVSLGKTHPRCLALLNSLANIYYAERKFADAELISQWLADFYSDNRGKHISTGIAMANLAMVLHAQGKYDQAEGCYKKALSIKLDAFGSGHPEVNALLLSYAKLLDITHRHVEADHFRTCSVLQA